MTRRTRNMVVAAVVFLTGVSILVAAPEHGKDEAAQLEKMKTFIGMMTDYVTLSDKWTKAISTKEGVALFVAESVKQIHEKKGDKAKAIPVLRKMIEKGHHDAGVKRVIHFKIKDIYEETGDHDAALKELEIIMDSLR